MGVSGRQHSQILEGWWEPERKRFQQGCGSEKGCGSACCVESGVEEGAGPGDQEEWPSDGFCGHSQEYRAKNEGGQIGRGPVLLGLMFLLVEGDR